MNFKFTLWKSVVSFLTIIFVDFLLSSSVNLRLCNMMPGGGPCLQPPWYEEIFYSGFIIVSLIIGLIVYFVWSLIQKGKKRR